MVKIGLQIRATFENVEELKTTHPDYPFFLKLKCSNCGEQSDKWHDITESERTNEDSRNPDGFNFYMKCKLCSRENSIDIVEGSNGKITSAYSISFSRLVLAIILFFVLCSNEKPLIHQMMLANLKQS